MFIIAINDLPKCNPTDTIMNADDNTSFGKSDCLSVLYNTMAQATDHIVHWFKIKILYCNPNKTSL